MVLQKTVALLVLLSLLHESRAFKHFLKNRLYGAHSQLSLKKYPENGPVKEFFFSQKLDHFNSSNTQTWQQVLGCADSCRILFLRMRRFSAIPSQHRILRRQKWTILCHDRLRGRRFGWLRGFASEFFLGSTGSQRLGQNPWCSYGSCKGQGPTLGGHFSDPQTACVMG